MRDAADVYVVAADHEVDVDRALVDPVAVGVADMGGIRVAECEMAGGVLVEQCVEEDRAGLVDSAGAIGARREVAKAGGALPFLVTVAINRVEFKRPVMVGDVVTFKTNLVKIGHTSITMHVAVESERGADTLQVTEAELVYVGINPTDRTPQPLLPGV